MKPKTYLLTCVVYDKDTCGEEDCMYSQAELLEHIKKFLNENYIGFNYIDMKEIENAS